MLLIVLIEQLVASRDGVITLEAALSGGLSPHQVQHRVRTGRWIRLYPRVYLVERRDPDVTVYTRAAVAWAGSGAVASGLTAAWWWGLRNEAPGVTEVTVPWRRSLRRQAGVIVRRRDLDLADLVVFRGLAVTALPLTVLEGAAKLHVAQPGVSAQIRRLERELGQELLDRSGRSVRLTEVGAAVLPYARAALSAVAGARLAVDELTGLVRGHVAMGTVTSHNIDLSALLAEFHEDHPGVEITLVEGNSDQLIDALRGSRLDAAIISLGATPPPDLEIRIVADEPIAAAVSHGDDLAKRSTIPLTALRDRALISLPPGSGIRSHLDGACAAAGFTPHIAFEASTPTVLAQLAARGLGVAIVPASIAHSQDDLHPLTITRPELRGRLALAWRSEGPISPAARALIKRVRRSTKPY